MQLTPVGSVNGSQLRLTIELKDPRLRSVRAICPSDPLTSVIDDGVGALRLKSATRRVAGNCLVRD